MKKISSYIFIICQFVILLLSLVTNWYVALSYFSFFSILILILDKLGKGIVLREMIALYSVFINLTMPALGYSIYANIRSIPGVLMKRMVVTEEVYFNLALPAMTAFTIALCWPLSSKGTNDQGAKLAQLVANAKNVLLRQQMKKISLGIVLVGLIMFFVSGSLPQELQFIFLLFYFSAFAGLLYVYYLPSFKLRWLVLLLFILFIVYNALRTGMFTVVAYMGITMFSFFFLGSKINFMKKVIVFASGILILMLVQTIKPTYRKSTWKEEYGGSKAQLFFTLVSDQLTKGEFFSLQAFYPIYYRTNQGFNVGLVMRRIPHLQPHDDGKNLLVSISSAFVPRVLWPNKPEAGGKANMKYYAGVTIRGWSTNVGPLGEAYGAFGVQGAILFMLFLGWFIRWAYVRVFTISTRIPLLLFWLPVLFYQITYSAETDTLQIFNSLIKSAFFIWLLYKIFPAWFGILRSESNSNTGRRRILNKLKLPVQNGNLSQP